MDTGGRLAARGVVDQRLLAKLTAHPFLKRRPPKSTGREEFGGSFISNVLTMARRHRLRVEDILATCALFTAVIVARSRRWLSGSVEEVVVGGGGAYNRTVMVHLAREFAPVPVRTFDTLGWPSKAFEAVAFAVLAYLSCHGECGNAPSATGAAKPVVLGTMVPGRRRYKIGSA